MPQCIVVVVVVVVIIIIIIREFFCCTEVKCQYMYLWFVFYLAGNFGITEELPDDDDPRHRNMYVFLDTIKY